MRLFLAIELPAEAREHLARVQQAMAPAPDRASITRDTAMHITVRFLGETEPAKLDEISGSLATVVGGPMELMATHANGYQEEKSPPEVTLFATGETRGGALS